VEGSSGLVLVRMEGITKRFPGVLANDNVSFELRAGEVHALLGENGAGKTTLMNILYGLYRPDEGRILIEGREVDIRSPKDAISLGIGMVHQHFKLIPTLTVAENVALGLERTGFFMPTKVVEGKIRELSERYGLKVDPKARVWQLSVGERQRVEIIKVLMRDAKVLILDEPTTVLAPAERDQLFSVIRRLADEGRGIIFITHKLGEVKAVSDRVTVLRKGRVVVSGIPTDSVSTQELARMMVGRELLSSVRGGGGEGGSVVLEVRGLSVLGDRGLLAVKDVSFEVREGEILGIAGVAGNGQRELVEAIVGLRKPVKGSVRIGGVEVSGRSPREILSLGVSFIPEDRVGVGIVPDLSVEENLILRSYFKPPFSKGLMLDTSYISRWSEGLMKEYNIVAPGLKTPAGVLSGGNVQRLILARELSYKPKLIVASHPTYGLDLAATEYIRSLLASQRDRGAAVLLVSEDLEEIMALSDRIAVMFEGELVGGVMNASEVDSEKLGEMMCGAWGEGG